MLVKNYSKSGRLCRVTFKLPSAVEAGEVYLVGDFNDWDATTTPMKRLKSGDYSVTLSLDVDRSYRFRYLVDGQRWVNDWQADEYVPNEFGTEDSVVKV
jgi:1,4-alpha-glucan branching enzyme